MLLTGTVLPSPQKQAIQATAASVVKNARTLPLMRDLHFNLRLHCHPSLPQTRKHGCHMDPCIFNDDPDGEFYCADCEKETGHTLLVLVTAEWLFAARIKFVTTEVMQK
ncbi:hypothetical protein OIU85_026302 [Salix viminalis]|uniref:Uncharacterized protein n=1 Tax=Salix viminalis TaxID=40686 RepID=A0A9Q0YYG7_SALVM|nr:hypothetical protein OIU85_026302 [Salix viminalis]